MKKALNSVRQRILLAFLLLAMSGVASGVWNITLLYNHEERVKRLQEESLPTLIAAYEISRQGESITKTAASLIIMRDKWARDALIKRIHDQFNWIDSQLDLISRQGYGADKVDQIRQHKYALQQNYTDLIQAIEIAHQSPTDTLANNAVEMDVAIERLLQQNNHDADLLSLSVANLANSVSKEIETLITQTQVDIHDEVLRLIAYAVGAALFALVVVLYLDVNVGRRVVAIQRAMRAVADGDKREEIPHGGNDEISDMGSALGTFVDKLGEREELLQEHVQKTEEANKAKSTFLAAASHDMRQPLQAMSLFLYALRHAENSRANLEIISFLEKSASSLGHILDSLLDLSRLESGVVKIDTRTFPISVMCDHLVDEFCPIAADKGLGLTVVACSLSVRSDPILLENILRNLIANAIKNTDSGKVLVGCRRKGLGKVHIQVWDTGKGIAKDQQEQIFDEFYQLGSNPANAEKGLGLGLSIVQKVAALLNHELSVTSELGHGAMFSIAVPCVRQAPVQQRELKPPNKPTTPENLSIIVIDDEDAVRKSLAIMLSASNNRVFDAPSVDNDDEAAMRLFPQELPNIIIADYRLANGNTGTEAIARLRQFYKKDIPAILLTGDTLPSLLHEIAQAGHALLHKPVNGEEILLCIKDVLDGAANGLK